MFSFLPDFKILQSNIKNKQDVCKNNFNVQLCEPS